MAFSCLLIDLDGVIRRWTNNDQLKLAIPLSAIHQVAFEPELLARPITGVISDEEWREEIVMRLGSSYELRDCQEAVRAWSESPGVVDREVVDVLLASPYVGRITLVTNATSRLEGDLEALGIRHHFAHIVNSSALGFAKPDDRIFLYALQAAGCEASGALLVDDTAANVHAAEALGITSHQFTTAKELARFLQT